MYLNTKVFVVLKQNSANLMQNTYIITIYSPSDLAIIMSCILEIPVSSICILEWGWGRSSIIHLHNLAMKIWRPYWIILAQGLRIMFIIYLQKIPLDTTYFPTQKYKIPYHATNVIFSVSPSYIFYPPRKNPAPDGRFCIRLAI